MLGEYKVNRCTRHCHALNRPLKDGEWYYSVVMQNDEDFVRRDYSAEGWQGPPDDAIGWWKNRMPTADDKQLVPAPPEVLIDLLQQMANFPDRAKSRYLLALMLMRRRIIRPAQVSSAPNKTATQTSTNEQSTSEILAFEVISDRSIIEVASCEISRSEAETLRAELDELLYCETPDPDDLAPDDTDTRQD